MLLFALLIGLSLSGPADFRASGPRSDNASSLADGPGSGPFAGQWFTTGLDCREGAPSCMVSGDGQVIFLAGAVILQVGEASSSDPLRLTFPGSQIVAPVGMEPLPHRTNHYLGSDPEHWRTGILNFRQVVYPGLYPGIDLAYYHSAQGLKYDWLVSAWADPSNIRELYEDVVGEMRVQVELEGDGGLVVNLAGGGKLDQASPVCMQETVVVTCSYQLISNDHADLVGYDLGYHDPSRPLVIDPLIFSTYLGGNDWEAGSDLVIDEHGYLYVTGHTGSRTFPTTPGALERSHQGGSHDVFVTRLSADGSRLLYSTFIGGGDRDTARALALGPDGDLFVTGSTGSLDFPLTSGAHDRSLNGSSDGFVLRLDLDSGELVFATLLGGGDYEDINDLAVDGQGYAFVTGITGSSDFPVAGADASGGDVRPDLFVSRLSPDGSELNLSTMIGGDDYESGMALDLDGTGTAWVAGRTRSADFPTTLWALDDSHNGGDDGFILGVNLTGATTYSTLLGGAGDEAALALLAGPALDLYVAGSTDSGDFPTTPGALSRQLRGSSDGFVLRLAPGEAEPRFSTLIGGTGDEEVLCLLRDPQDQIIGAGHTDSHNFPSTAKGEYPSLAGDHDGMVFRMDASGSQLSYASYLGGEAYDSILGLALGETGHLIMTGGTASGDFPTTPGANDTQANGYEDVFVTGLDMNLPPAAFINKVDPRLAHEGEAVSFSGSGEDPDGAIFAYRWRSDIDGVLDHNASFSTTGLSPGNHTIFLAVMDGYGTWSEEVNTTLRVNMRPEARIEAIEGLPVSQGDQVMFNGSGVDWDGHLERYRWRSDLDGILSSQATFTTSSMSGGEHRVYLAVRDNEGAWSHEAWARVVINSRPTVTLEPPYLDLVNQGDLVNLTGLALDPDGHIIQYRWELDGQVLPQYQSLLGLDNLTPGRHRLNLTVQDNESAWSDPATLEVEVNARPLASIEWVSHATAGEGWSVTFAGQAHDPDGEVLSYEWSSSLDGEFGDDENFTTSELSPGNHTISLRVMDDDGAWSEAVTVTLVVTPSDEKAPLWPWFLAVLVLLMVLGLIVVTMVRRRAVPHVDDLPPGGPAGSPARAGIPVGAVGKDEPGSMAKALGALDGGPSDGDDVDGMDWGAGIVGTAVDVETEGGRGREVTPGEVDEAGTPPSAGPGPRTWGRPDDPRAVGAGAGADAAGLAGMKGPEEREREWNGVDGDERDERDEDAIANERKEEAEKGEDDDDKGGDTTGDDGPETRETQTGPESASVTCPTCFNEVSLKTAAGTGRVTCQNCWDQFTIDR